MHRPAWVAAVLIAELLLAVVFIARPDAPAVNADPAIGMVSLGGSRTDALLVRTGAVMAGATADVQRFWGTDWGGGGVRRIVIVATDSDLQFAAQAHLDPRQQWTDIAAVAVADDVDVTARRVIGQRIVLAPGAATMTDSALRIVLTHELFHLAARADTALDAPRWLTEGVADFVARPASSPPGDADTVLPSDPALPTDADFALAGPARSAGYDRAWLFARLIAETYGTDGLRRLYVQSCGPGHKDFDESVRRALGIEPADLRARWAQWLTRERDR